MPAGSQTGEGSLASCCPLSSPEAAAERQLLLWTEMLNGGWSRCGLNTISTMTFEHHSYSTMKYDSVDRAASTMVCTTWREGEIVISVHWCISSNTTSHSKNIFIQDQLRPTKCCFSSLTSWFDYLKSTGLKSRKFDFSNINVFWLQIQLFYLLFLFFLSEHAQVLWSSSQRSQRKHELDSDCWVIPRSSNTDTKLLTPVVKFNTIDVRAFDFWPPYSLNNNEGTFDFGANNLWRKD